MIPHFRPLITDRDAQEITSALGDRHLSDGVITEALEDDISVLFGSTNAVAASSGTACLYLALKALDVGRGDKVVIPSYTCNSLFAATTFAGADAICADCGTDGLTLTKESISKVLNQDVKCIIVSHTLGFLADIDRIRQLQVPVVEDFSQAFGARFHDGSQVGLKGDVGVASLHATKLFSAAEGGVCLTKCKGYADTIRTLRNCDGSTLNPHAFNFKMSDINAALGRTKLSTLFSELALRRKMRNRYDRDLVTWTPDVEDVQRRPVCFRYLISSPHGAAKTITMAQERGVECRRPIRCPLHISLGGECPNAEDVFLKTVSVPFHLELSESQVDYVCTSMARICGME